MSERLRFCVLALALASFAAPVDAQDAPTTEPVWAVLADQGEALRVAGDLDSAAVLLDRARALGEGDAPTAARVHIELALGAIDAQRGDTSPSLAAFARALALDPAARLPESLADPRATAAFALALALSGQPTIEPEAPVIEAAVEPSVEATVVETEPVVEQEAELPIEEPLEELEPTREGLGTFALSAGIVGGFAWVSSGLPADTARPAGLGEDSPWTECDARGEQCSVRVRSAGFGSTLGIRIAAHVQPLPNLFIGLGVRSQPASGNGFLAGWLFDLELRGRPVDFGELPLSLELIVAGGLGQVQVRPPQDEIALGPFVQSGPGWVSAGAALAIRVEDGIEIVGELLPRFSFPSFLFVLDASLSLRVGSALL